MENGIPYDLISKHLEGETSEQEDKILWQWIESAPSHLKVFQDLIEVYSGRTILSDEWLKEKRKIIDVIISERKVGLKNIPFWKIAASVLVLFLAGIYLYKKNGLKIVEVKTIAGEVKIIFLPDSTSIWLNSNTTIRYAERNFSQDRRVELSGEAFFSVKNIEGNEFQIVYDSTILITDSGEFNIQSYDRKNEKTVTISEGAAKFLDLRKDGLIMKGTTGQRIVSLNGYGILSLEINQDVNFKSWLTGTYAFDNIPASAVAELLSKDQGIEVHIPDKELRYQFLSGIYESCNAERLMHHLMNELNAKLEIRNHTYYLIKSKDSSKNIQTRASFHS
jgi:transmembrane sensor